MLIMGIDPGLTRCGLGVIEASPDRRVQLIHVEVLRSDAQVAAHFRLRTIGEGISAAIERYEPQIVAIERVFAHDNRQSVTGTSHAMGVAMYCAALAGLPLAIHTPSEVKAAVTGSGTAGKAQVQNMVARVLGLSKIPSPADAADALAIAITQAWRGTALAGAPADSLISISLSGGVTSRSDLTPAQAIWAQAAAEARRSGATDPRRKQR